jgi:hypothetical protein
MKGPKIRYKWDDLHQIIIFKLDFWANSSCKCHVELKFFISQIYLMNLTHFVQKANNAWRGSIICSRHAGKNKQLVLPFSSDFLRWAKVKTSICSLEGEGD